MNSVHAASTPIASISQPSGFVRCREAISAPASASPAALTGYSAVSNHSSRPAEIGTEATATISAITSHVAGTGRIPKRVMPQLWQWPTAGAPVLAPAQVRVTARLPAAHRGRHASGMNTTRVSALSASAVTAVAVVYALACAASGWDPSLGWLLQAAIHLGELAAVAALAWSGAVGGSRPGRAGLALAVAGQLLMAVAEVVYPHAHNLGDALFSVA